MHLFKMQIDRKREGRELVVHADSPEAATAHVRRRFSGWEITDCIEILGEAHFTIALLEPD
jgi:hypothetical protein